MKMMPLTNLLDDEPTYLGKRLAVWNPTRMLWENPNGVVDLFSEHSEPFWETWPSSGMTRNGAAYELPTPVHHTGDTGYSFLPTPKAGDAEWGLPRTSGRPPEMSTHLATKIHFTVPGQAGTEALLKTPTSQLAVNGGSQHPDKRKQGGHGPALADEVEHLLPTPAAMNPNDGEQFDTWEARRIATKARVKNGNGFGTPLAIAVQKMDLLPTPTTQDAANTGGGITVPPKQPPAQHARDDIAWGVYEPAIRRWETVLGRPAPSPTNPDGRDGSHRLAAEFVEWMQGLDAGHVTDPAIGLTRNQQLKALGNGVVKQQAAMAVRYLLGMDVA